MAPQALYTALVREDWRACLLLLGLQRWDAAMGLLTPNCKEWLSLHMAS